MISSWTEEYSYRRRIIQSFAGTTAGSPSEQAPDTPDRARYDAIQRSHHAIARFLLGKFRLNAESSEDRSKAVRDDEAG